MCNTKSPMLAIIAWGILFLSASAIQAQVTTATIYGNVTDSSGAKLSGATVTITNEQTNATQSSATNEDGEFTFNFLQVGSYRLSVAAPSFKEQNQNNVVVSAGQRLRLTYALEIGEISEKVLITTEPPLINSVNAEQLISHGTTEVRELPLIRRDWTNLLNIGTGVDVKPSGGGTGVVLNGLPP